MNRDMPLKSHHGKLDTKHVKRHRNLRRVSSRLDPDELDGMATREAMRSRGAGWRTDFGPNTGPLVKFLEHRLGRKWDKVFSEVSHAFGREGREMVRDKVLTHTRLDDQGRIVVNDTPWCGMLLKDICGYNLYVDPRDGVLRASGTRYAHDSRYREMPTAIVRGRRAYFLRNGLWFVTRPSDHRALAERIQAKMGGEAPLTEAWMLLSQRLAKLPTLWTPQTESFICDPDATRQLSSRRVAQLGLDPAQVADAGEKRPG